jgi:hypothetical protein
MCTKIGTLNTKIGTLDTKIGTLDTEIGTLYTKIGTFYTVFRTKGELQKPDQDRVTTAITTTYPATTPLPSPKYTRFQAFFPKHTGISAL